MSGLAQSFAFIAAGKAATVLVAGQMSPRGADARGRTAGDTPGEAAFDAILADKQETKAEAEPKAAADEAGSTFLGAADSAKIAPAANILDQLGAGTAEAEAAAGGLAADLQNFLAGAGATATVRPAPPRPASPLGKTDALLASQIAEARIAGAGAGAAAGPVNVKSASFNGPRAATVARSASDSAEKPLAKKNWTEKNWTEKPFADRGGAAAASVQPVPPIDHAATARDAAPPLGAAGAMQPCSIPPAPDLPKPDLPNPDLPKDALAAAKNVSPIALAKVDEGVEEMVGPAESLPAWVASVGGGGLRPAVVKSAALEKAAADKPEPSAAATAASVQVVGQRAYLPPVADGWTPKSHAPTDLAAPKSQRTPASAGGETAANRLAAASALAGPPPEGSSAAAAAPSLLPQSAIGASTQKAAAANAAPSPGADKPSPLASARRDLEITLAPQEWGGLSVRMKASGDRLDLAFVADKGETARMIADKSPNLASQLHGAGVGLGGIDISSVAARPDTGAPAASGGFSPSLNADGPSLNGGGASTSTPQRRDAAPANQREKSDESGDARPAGDVGGVYL